ncbi:hypothetical protein QF002_001990 [Paraburkholderia youngii]
MRNRSQGSVKIHGETQLIERPPKRHDVRADRIRVRVQTGVIETHDVPSDVADPGREFSTVTQSLCDQFLTVDATRHRGRRDKR